MRIIEYVHKNKLSIVNQREIGADSGIFSAAIRAALRQNPDVILIGETRDMETIEIALTAAETGRLVFSTLHTVSAPKTIDRIVGIFPAEKQDVSALSSRAFLRRLSLSSFFLNTTAAAAWRLLR